MDLILLSGNSIKNKEWIEEVDHAVSSDFTATHIQYYDHWEKGEKMIDFDVEMEKLTKTVDPLEEYSIFAKSAGVLLALKGIYEGKINPARCVFAGTAVRFALRLGFDIEMWFGRCSVPTLFIHNALDPAISFEELEVWLKMSEMRDYKIQELHGHDHNYGDVNSLKKFITEFILR